MIAEGSNFLKSLRREIEAVSEFENSNDEISRVVEKSKIEWERLCDVTVAWQRLGKEGEKWWSIG